MLIERGEWTLAHVGLGALTEPALLTQFATTQAHHLTRGTGITLDQVVDVDGQPLYPGYLWLHLDVPASRCLDEHRLWQPFQVSVDVRRFGQVFLDTTSRLGRDNELSTGVAEQADPLPTMRSCSMFMATRESGEMVPSAPTKACVDDLPVLQGRPTALERCREMRVAGTFGRPSWPMSTADPIRYPLVTGRDVAVGRNLMFATYVTVMDAAEHQLLSTSAMSPPVPLAILDHRSLLEREMFFLGHAAAGSTICIEARAQLSRCPDDLHGTRRDIVSGGILEAHFELYDGTSHALLCVARCRKLFALPRAQGSLLSDLERWLRSVASRSEAHAVV